MDNVPQSVPKHEMEAYRASLMPLDQIISTMEESVNARFIAKFTGVSETRAVNGWKEGNRKPKASQEFRLRLGSRIIGMLQDPEKPWVPEAWLRASNPC